jgi:hypothetical protein
VNLYPDNRNAVPRQSARGTAQPGRHARPATQSVSILTESLRDRSLERLRTADQRLSDAYTRVRGAGADSDIVTSAFGAAHDSIREAGEVVQEMLRDLALVVSEWEQLLPWQQASSRYPDTATPVVPDLPGEHLCPDPAAARTPAELMDMLRRYREWAGKRSYRAMEHVLKMRGGQRYAASTLHAALKGDAMPALAKVQAIIAACGGSDADQQMFTTAWRRLTIPR